MGSHSECFLTMGENKLIFWGIAAQLRGLVPSIPTKYNDKKYYFELPFFPSIVRHMEQVVKGLIIDIRLKKYIEYSSKSIEKFDTFKNAKDIDGFESSEIQTVIDGKLFPHQKVSSKINEVMPRVLCNDEMGLGKTIVAIRSALFRKKYSQNKRCLIICPSSIKETVWGQEIEKWTKENCCIPEGTKLKRENLIKKFVMFNKRDTTNYFMVINYEMVYKYQDLLGEFVKDQMLIIDESHYMKNYDSQRTKAIYKLKPRFLLSMTGTPFDNRVEDIYSLAEYVRPLIFGGSFTLFKDTYCVEDEISFHQKGKLTVRKVIKGYKNLDQLRTLLDLISYRRTKKEVLDLPEKTYQDRLIQMTPEQWKYYEKMREECYVSISQLDDVEIESTANGILAKMLRLSQITDGYITDFADKDRSHWIKNSGKLTELDDIVDEVILSGHKIVVWSRFVEVVHHIRDRYKEKYNAVAINGQVPITKRAEIVKQFQTDPSTKVFVGQIQSCGVGMTLHAASYEVFFDKCFINSSGILQAEDRCHRIGMGDRCTIISLIAKGTLDEYWEKILKNKLSAIDEVLNENNADLRDAAYKVNASQVSKSDILSLLKIKKGD